MKITIKLTTIWENMVLLFPTTEEANLSWLVGSLSMFIPLFIGFFLTGGSPDFWSINSTISTEGKWAVPKKNRPPRIGWVDGMRVWFPYFFLLGMGGFKDFLLCF